VNHVNGIRTGEEWQCVEFVNRLYLTKGWISDGTSSSAPWPGSAGPTFYNDAPSNLTKQLNGLVPYLGPGDVVIIDVFRNGSPDGGHALVVNDTTDVTSGTVNLVSQNSGYGSSSEPVVSGRISAGFVTVGGGGNGWTYGTVGVVHAPVSPPPQAGTFGTQLAELKGADSVRLEYFGTSVAISGDTAIVGAAAENEFSGRAYVFAKTQTGWKRTAELKGSDSVTNDEFGNSVAISRGIVIVGAWGHVNGAGRAYVFTKTGNGWRQVAELKASDGVAHDGFGYSVAISGATAVVGAADHANAGRAYVFTKAAAGWKQTAELKGADTEPGNELGFSVAISGATAVLGAPDYAGRAYVLTDTNRKWVQRAELQGSDSGENDSFGYSVAISGATVVVDAGRSGRAYVFTKTQTGWKQAAELHGSDTAAPVAFGRVAISGNTVLVGASGQANGAGRAYVFTKTGNGWRQVAELKGSDGVAHDGFGYSVAISGTTAIVGAFNADNRRGRAYLFAI
jgi:nucleoside-specific outer membrane channel protein Tsx